jgi:GTPase SAR1 family protein
MYMTTNIERFRTFEIVVIGDSNVGKSSLITRFFHGIFQTEYYATIGVDVQIAIINIGDYKCRLQIWFVYSLNTLRSFTVLKFVKQTELCHIREPGRSILYGPIGIQQRKSVSNSFTEFIYLRCNQHRFYP